MFDNSAKPKKMRFPPANLSIQAPFCESFLKRKVQSARGKRQFSLDYPSNDRKNLSVPINLKDSQYLPPSCLSPAPFASCPLPLCLLPLASLPLTALFPAKTSRLVAKTFSHCWPGIGAAFHFKIELTALTVVIANFV